jgi:hypothetical protein
MDIRGVYMFSSLLLHNHFITEFFFKKKSGDVNDEANFSFFFLLHKRAKPALPPYLLPHSARELKPFTPPLPSPFRPGRSATVGRVDLDFCKHFVEGCERLGLFLEQPPKPVLEHGERSLL